MISLLNFAHAVLHPIDHIELSDGWVEVIESTELNARNLKAYKDMYIHCPVCTIAGLIFKFIFYLKGGKVCHKLQ